MKKPQAKSASSPHPVGRERLFISTPTFSCLYFNGYTLYNRFMKEPKTPTAFRLSHKGKLLLSALAEKLGVNQTAVVEMAIRQMADKERIEVRESHKEIAAR
jgi:hypothetical protein